MKAINDSLITSLLHNFVGFHDILSNVCRTAGKELLPRSHDVLYDGVKVIDKGIILYAVYTLFKGA